MADYLVVLIAKDGTEIAGAHVCGSIKEAKAKAARLVGDEWAKEIGPGTAHEMLDTEKVEIRNDAGEVIWDKFR